MPLLPTGGYSAQVGQLPISGGRRATAEDDPVAAAVGQFSHVTQDVGVRVMEQRAEDQARKALVASSEIRAQTAKEVQDAEVSGSDLGPIKEKMQAAFSKLSEQFDTKQGASTTAIAAANANLMFDAQANRISVQRAFSDATSGANKLVSTEAGTVAGNPAYLPVAIGNLNDYVDTFKNIRPDQRTHLKDHFAKQLNMSAVLSSIRNGDPKAVEEELTAGKYDLDAEQRNLALNFAQTRQNLLRERDALLRADEKRQLQEKDLTAYDKWYKEIRTPGADLVKVEQGIMTDSDLLPHTRPQLVNLMKARTAELNGEGKRPNHEEYKKLWLSITSTDDAKRIINGDAIRASVASPNGINTEQADKLLNLVAGQADENNRKIQPRIRSLAVNYERSFAGDLRMRTFDATEQAQITNEYGAAIEERVGAMRAANDVKGLRDLFDPTSKTYVGSAVFMEESKQASINRMKEGLPQPVDLRAEPDKALTIEVGQSFIDPHGRPTKMTPALHEALRKEKPVRGPTATGNISDVAAP